MKARALALGALLLALAAPAAGEPPGPLPLCEAALAAGQRSTPAGELYHQAELNPMDGLSPELRGTLQEVLRSLQARGVQVVLALVPARILAVPERYAPLEGYEAASAAARATYDETRAWFETQGVPAPDLLAAVARVEGPFFNRLDHHWSPAGARAAAEVLAESLEGHPVRIALPRVLHSTVQSGTVPLHDGWQAKRILAECGVALPEEHIPRYVSQAQQLGLLEEVPVAQVALVGTSFSQPSFNFAGSLADALETPVDNRAVSAGGLYTAVHQLLRALDAGSARPTLVIWELPQGTLLVGSGRSGSAPEGDDLAYQHELRATARGACTPAAALAQVEVPAGATELELFSLRRPAAAVDLVLALDVPTEGLRVQFQAGAQRAELAVQHYARLDRGGVLLLEPPLAAPLTSVRLALPAPAPSPFTARLCPRMP